MTRHKAGNQSRSEVAYQKLLLAIQHGDLSPGTRLREVEMAERFGISRTPIRDAIRRLESDGLVLHVPHQGAMIRQLSHREVSELYDVRTVLEGTAAQYATQQASDLEIAELDYLNELMLKNAGDPVKVADANRLFHQCLYRIANNRFLIESLNALSNSMTLLGGTTLKEVDRTQEAYEEHQAIIQAMKEGNKQQAELAAQLHIRNAQRIRVRLFSEAQIENKMSHLFEQ